jgi:hypothetical protein
MGTRARDCSYQPRRLARRRAEAEAAGKFDPYAASREGSSESACPPAGSRGGERRSGRAVWSVERIGEGGESIRSRRLETRQVNKALAKSLSDNGPATALSPITQHGPFRLERGAAAVWNFLVPHRPARGGAEGWAGIRGGAGRGGKSYLSRPFG